MRQESEATAGAGSPKVDNRTLITDGVMVLIKKKKLKNQI